MSRLPLVVVPALALAGLVFFLTVLAPRLLAGQLPPTPEQPIAFDHRVHTQVAGIDCAFCHRTAAQGPTAGYPDLQQCMFCHQVVGQGQPEIEKVRQAWVEQRPIDWVRVHRMPDHVHFVHDAHIKAGLPCATCHGEVASMQQVRQVRSLKMNDCVACHQERSAPTECGACHY
jgi:Cytochrome c7 and related cytochrome c/Class III cytochrome C family